MKEIGIKQARQTLPELIDQIEAGEEIVLTRRGKVVARLIPAPRETKTLPPLKEFRQRVAQLGTPAAKLLREDRDAR